jgi:hypothetical protein
VRLIAFDRIGAPVGGADVIVHDSYGDIFARTTLGADGTGEVESVAGATITVAIRKSDDSASLLKESGELTTFTDVPLDVTLHVGARDPSNDVEKFDVDLVVPEFEGTTYEVTVGCDGNGFPDIFGTTDFTLRVPVGCGTRPRTIVVMALSESGFVTQAISVLRDVDLHAAGPIQMPAFEPARDVDIDIANHDSSTAFYLGRLSILDADGTYTFFDGADHEKGHVTAKVPAGEFAFTRYERELVLDGGFGLIETIHQQIDAGAPTSTAISDDDFLPAPAAGEGDFGFTFDADVDARRLDLTYRCFKCNARGQWTLFGPSSQEPFTLPELPADLRSLTPDGAYIDSIVGNIFENSEQDGYLDFLNAGPEPVAATHRQALIVLRSNAD